MRRLRIVVDTNVLVSAVIKFVGSEAFVLDSVAAHQLELFVTEAIVTEYWSVLGRPRLRLDRARRDQILSMIAVEGKFVKPLTRIVASPDESDNRFLECAETAAVDFLVTGNKRHFPKTWKTTEVVNARELLDLLEPR